MHPDTAHAYNMNEDDWVDVEVAGIEGRCKVRLKLSDGTQRNVVSTGMGWWRPSEAAPEHGVLEININAVLSYSGPFDPISGSSNIRGLRCRVISREAV